VRNRRHERRERLPRQRNDAEITSSGTASFLPASSSQPGGIDNFEIAGLGDGPLAPDRSHSTGGTPVGVITQPKPVTTSNPNLITSFDGLNHFDQRFGSSAGANQFSLEPPDQGLCVGSDGNGHTRILEVINDVLRVSRHPALRSPRPPR
jgi:hypothetical protein